MSRSRILDRTYTRDDDGRFAESAGGADDDESVAELSDEELYGFDELNQNGDGSSRFSESYMAAHGKVVSSYGPIGPEGEAYSIAVTEKKSFHVADDSKGTQNREVLEDLSPAKARALSDAVYEVYSNGGERSTGGVTVRGDGGNSDVRVTWSSGKSTTFEGERGNDSAFELQEGLNFEADTYTSEFGARNASTFHVRAAASRRRVRRVERSMKRAEGR